VRELARRVAAGELRPDFGPSRVDLRRGAVLVAARPPLVAFNLRIAGEVQTAREVARMVREGGPEGLAGVRALGLEVDGEPQVSTNVEDHRATPLAALLEAVARHATVIDAELVGLAPQAAFAGWPDGVPIRNRRTLEDVLGS
jgi:glutamate formiminotransferase